MLLLNADVDVDAAVDVDADADGDGDVDVDAGCWLTANRWQGRWVLCVGILQGTGWWVLGAGCWVLGAGCGAGCCVLGDS